LLTTVVEPLGWVHGIFGSGLHFLKELPLSYGMTVKLAPMQIAVSKNSFTCSNFLSLVLTSSKDMMTGFFR
jgi:hypothetical protein